MVLFSFAAWRFALYLWRAGATPAVCGLLMAGLPCCATTEALYVSPAVLGGTLEFGWKERHFVWCRDLFIPRACDEHKTTSLEVASVVQGQADFSEPPHTPGVRLRNFLHQRYDVAAQSPYLGLKSRAHCHGLGRGAEGGGGGRGQAPAYQVMMYCRCSFRRVTLVCPPMGPPGTVLSAGTQKGVLTVAVGHTPTTDTRWGVEDRRGGGEDWGVLVMAY